MNSPHTVSVMVGIRGRAFRATLPFGVAFGALALALVLLRAQAPITVTPANPTIVVGQTQQFTASGAIAPTAIAGGSFHTCLRLSDSTVECVGHNNFGQLGNGTINDSLTPVAVNGVTNAVSIETGVEFSCALMADGTIRCWGSDFTGQLGNGASGTFSTVPVSVIGINNAVAAMPGGFHACAVLSDQTVQCWGRNADGQLGDGTTVDSSVPRPVSNLPRVAALTAGAYHTCALLPNGTVQCWGRNDSGQLGNGTRTSASVPVQVSGITSATAVAGGGFHTCALLANGTAQCWGQNDLGQIGLPTSTAVSSVPVSVNGITNAVALLAGGYHTCAVLGNGTLWCWGENDFGELGDGTVTTSPTPVQVRDITSPSAVTAGAWHTCAVILDRSAQCWGRNTYGQLGNGTTTSSSIAAKVRGTGLTWTNSDTRVAVIDVTGLATGLDAGVTTITVTDGVGTSTSTTLTVQGAQVATPTFSPADGAYSGPVTVTISDATNGATIYYTTDASTPTTSSLVYTGPLTFTQTTTLKVIAAKNGMTNSAVASATYTIQQQQVATPTFSPPGGTYSGSVTVTISDATSGATIYYTTDGSTPTTSSQIYTGPLTFTQTTTLRAMAAKSGMTNSAVADPTYTIQQPSFMLTVSKTGLGSGTVTSSPAGINCGVTCSASYASGTTTLVLTATPAAGSAFGGWSGGGCSGTGSCNLTLAASTTVTASFAIAGVSAPVLMWQYGGCLSGPYCQKGWYSSPAVTDLDGDGKPDVIWGAGDVVALDGATGSLKWRATSDKRVWPGIVVADLTGSGTPEVIVGRDYDELTVYDRFGNVIWRRNPFGGNGELRTLAVTDLEKDGRLEIIVGNAGSSTYELNAFEPDGSVRTGWPVRHSGDPGYGSGLWNANAAVADMRGDGFKEVFTTTASHYVTAVDRNGNQLAVNSIYAPRQVWSEVGTAVDNAAELRGYVNCGVENRPYLGESAPAIADVNGDGIPEVVVVGNVYDCSTSPYTDLYHLPFIFNLDRTRWSGSGFDWTVIPTPGTVSGPRSEDYNVIELAEPNAVVADLDGDGFKEILFPSYDGKLHAYWLDKTEHGSWPYTIPTSGASGDDFRFASEPIVVDLNNDGHAEVIFTTWPKKASGRVGQLIVLDYLGHELSRTDLPAPAIGATWNGALSAPTIANIDSDPDLELVVGTVASGVVAYKFPNTANARVLWGTGRGNYGRTGTTLTTGVGTDPTPPTVAIMSPPTGATVSGTITATASASDGAGVVGVQFKLDGANLGAETTSPPYSTSWNTITATNGSHTLTAVTRDGAGDAATSAAVMVTVSNADTTPPTVAIMSPANGATVSGAITVSATASDNVGVIGVQFFVDDVALGRELTSAPYTGSWDTTTASNGTHTLAVVARDAADNRSSAAVSVTVFN